MYDVMAVGNALVDHEYLLTDDQLTNTSLTKGCMTLASLNEQTELLNQFKSLQLSPSKQSGGGSAANAMFALSCLGGKSFYSCRVGNDAAGQFYLSDLNEAGVATSTISIAENGVTGSCVVAISPDGERTMQTYLGASSEIEDANVDFDTLRQSEWLYIEGYLAMSETLRSAIQTMRQQAAESGTKIAVSFADPSVINFAKDGLLEILGDGVDTIFCNVEEAMLFNGANDIVEAAKALTKYCHLAVVTNGADDTVICERLNDNNLSITIVATPTVPKVIDTNGAGDNYSGAFLYALIKGHSLTECGELAGKVATQIVQQFGPRLTANQYQAIAKQVLAA